MKAIEISRLDHFVLTVRDIKATIEFYVDVLGMAHEKFASGGELRNALLFGSQKINLHQQGNEFKPGADYPQPGSADFCLITRTPITDVVTVLTSQNVDIIEGPIKRTGATGALNSVYCRDPDDNLVEISNLLEQVGDS